MMVLVIFIATGRDNSFLPGCPSVQVHPSGPACGHVRTGMISPIAISGGCGRRRSNTAHDAVAISISGKNRANQCCHLPGREWTRG